MCGIQANILFCCGFIPCLTELFQHSFFVLKRLVRVSVILRVATFFCQEYIEIYVYSGYIVLRRYL